MELSELATILKATGYPVAYSHFKSEQTTPFICYTVAYSSNFIADNKVYERIDNVQVELYTSKKDLVAEKKVEEALNNSDLPYQSIETFLDEEAVFQIIYEISI